MAIAQQNELITEIRGSIGDRTFRYHNGAQIIQRRSSPGRHTTPAAMRSKNNFAYTAFTLSKQIESTKDRLRFLASGQNRNFFNYFAGLFYPLGTTQTQEIPLPHQTAGLELEGFRQFKSEGNVAIEWSSRSTDPNDFVEIIDATFHSTGEFSGDTHISIPLNSGRETIFGDSWVGIVFRTKNGTRTSPTFGLPIFCKQAINFDIKPRI